MSYKTNTYTHINAPKNVLMYTMDKNLQNVVQNIAVHIPNRWREILVCQR